MRNHSALIPCLALLLDEGFGDPPNRWHAVAWLGSAIGAVERRIRRAEPSSDFLAGLGTWLGGVLLVGGVVSLLSGFLHKLPRPLSVLGEDLPLKLSFSQRGLREAAKQVEQALENADLTEARKQLAWHLVSRDTSSLDESQVAGATIESVAENTSDGIFAPLLYYAFGGVPLVWIYRFTNTLDSMWGYRTERYEWLGKAAAHLDDLLNWLPARLTACLLILSALLNGENPRRALAVVKRDARTTASPNAGYPMSAMAGALGIELEKVGHYRLGCGLPAPKAKDISRAIRLMETSVLMGMMGISLFMLAKGKTKQPPSPAVAPLARWVQGRTGWQS